MARLSQTDAPTVVQAAPGYMPAPLEGMPGTPGDVQATAAHADSVADTPDNVADYPGDKQPGIGLPLSALQAGAKDKTRVKKDAATTTRRQAGPSSSATVASSSSPSTMPKDKQLKDKVEEQLEDKAEKWPKDEMELQPKDKWLEDEVQQLVKEEKKKKKKKRGSRTRRRSCGPIFTARHLISAAADRLVPAETSKDTSQKLRHQT
jgi:hypothetical protein